MKNLKELRKNLGLSPKEMAEKLKVSVWMYYKIERGTRKPTYNFMARVKERFECNIDKVFLINNPYDRYVAYHIGRKPHLFTLTILQLPTHQCYCYPAALMSLITQYYALLFL